jgi:transposase
MGNVSTIGLDIAKSVFQIHGVNELGEVAIKRQLRRGDVVKFFQKLPPCVVGLEACGTAHYWGRVIAALGHTVKLMPPTRVKPYVKWGRKNDKVDAAACYEAVTRPSMQFVPLKTEDQQAALMMHRGRQLLVEQRTRLGNAIRAHLAEFGVIAAKGKAGLSALLALVSSPEDHNVPELIRPILAVLVTQFHAISDGIDKLDRQIGAWHRSNDDSVRLASVPQFGPIISSALVAAIGDANRFDTGRHVAAWIGLVPRQNSTGGKDRLGGITKTGDRYLRQLLMLAATGMVRRVKADAGVNPWLAGLLKRMPAKKAAIAMANKLARIAWAILAHGGTYRASSSATP